jgi:hypothetical protein
VEDPDDAGLEVAGEDDFVPDALVSDDLVSDDELDVEVLAAAESADFPDVAVPASCVPELDSADEERESVR